MTGFNIGLLKVFSAEGSKRELAALDKVLARLPPEVRNDVIRNTAFVVVNYGSFIVGIPDKKALIVLYFGDLPEKRWSRLIAHEIAHYYSQRHRPREQMGLYGDDEVRADKIADDWGFKAHDGI